MSKKQSKKQDQSSEMNIQISINEFGEIEHGFDINKVNEFLNKTTTDWRLQFDKSKSDKSEEE